MNMVLIIFIIIIVIFALHKELTESSDSYSLAYLKQPKRPSFFSLLRNITIAASYDKNTVRWRRCCLLSLVIIFVLFGVVAHKLPSTQEFIISFSSLFIIIYLFLEINAKMYSYKVEEIIKQNIKALKRMR